MGVGVGIGIGIGIGVMIDGPIGGLIACAIIMMDDLSVTLRLRSHVRRASTLATLRAPQPLDDISKQRIRASQPTLPASAAALFSHARIRT
jgi:hypothetical protein